MGKIGSNNIDRSKLAQQNRVQQNRAKQNRQADLKDSVKEARTSVADDAGVQDTRTKKKSQVKKKAPTETFTPTKVEKADDEKALQSETEVKAEQQETTQAGTGQVGDDAAAPKEKGTDELQTDFLNTFAQNTDPETMKAIGDKANKSLDRMAADNSYLPPVEVVMAAHSLNHANEVIQTKMPGASKKEVQAAAKSDPELAKALKLRSASQAYAKAQLKEEMDASPAEEGSAAGTVDSAKSAANGAEGSSAEGVDPFAKSPGDPSALGDDGEPPNGPPQQPPEAGPGQKAPWHVSPELQAKMMEENHATMMAIMKSMNDMAAERRKTMAEIMKVNADTASSISEIFSQIHMRRAAAQAKHFDMYMKLLTDSWG